ncbi:hypothetical protein C0030_002880 [Candidatus Liberibacter solanacearum]|uniref:Uncharacterized protein n=1 Tax=Candidatus Liberibacter solanacearum TaxID=556287 RepID=A0A3R7Q3Y1_9HYPH|nr:hypothetical protein C0030_002880 [Candidatus Liberibacter solanacearum]
MIKKTISAYEFLKKFPDSESARLHLERCLWPTGSICPKCNCSNN